MKNIYNIGRAINGISVNGDEWLLDEEDNLMEFECIEEAKQFLLDNGVDMDNDGLEDNFTFKKTNK